MYPSHVGGVFEHEFRGQEMAFKYAVERVNSRRDLLPFTKLTYDIQQSPADDSFLAAKKGKKNCKQFHFYKFPCPQAVPASTTLPTPAVQGKGIALVL